MSSMPTLFGVNTCTANKSREISVCRRKANASKDM